MLDVLRRPEAQERLRPAPVVGLREAREQQDVRPALAARTSPRLYVACFCSVTCCTPASSGSGTCVAPVRGHAEVPAGKDAERLRHYLRRDGHPVVDLQDHDGPPAAYIKIGSVKRAKGLKFGRVSLPRTATSLCVDGTAEVERVERERRELFVAMTRARDGLWTSRLTSDV